MNGTITTLVLLVALALPASTQEPSVRTTPPEARISAEAPGWRPLTESDFENVNCHADTWTWEGDLIRCTGDPIGVTRMRRPLTNFELSCEWRHLRSAGNSGIFIWSPLESLDRLDGPGLPEGIEIQVLDLGYKEAYERDGRTADWFTCHGDVFPVGASTMKPFPPVSPNGRRSFPTERHSRGVGQWNHYYVRAINGEVRLWVNGREVSGGSECSPRTGYLALESEGSPVEFRGLRIRELP